MKPNTPEFLKKKFEENLKSVPSNGGPKSVVTERYANLEEFKSEFGDYRVNNKTDNVCYASSPKENMVTNDPYTLQSDNKNY